MQKLQLRSMLQAWLEEDLGSGDITSELLVFGQQANAIIHAKEEGLTYSPQLKQGDSRIRTAFAC